MAPFLSKQDRAEWLIGLDRGDEGLQAFAGWLDELCRHALELTGRELPSEHAAVIVRLVAETEADEGTPDGPAVPVPKQYLPRAA